MYAGEDLVCYAGSFFLSICGKDDLTDPVGAVVNPGKKITGFIVKCNLSFIGSGDCADPFLVYTVDDSAHRAEEKT